jgi:hypothetical protein
MPRTTNFITTREREAVAAMSISEWLTVTQISHLADIPNPYAALHRALAHGVVERRESGNRVFQWRLTGKLFSFNASGIQWTLPCDGFEPGDEFGPLPEDVCGMCGHRLDGHRMERVSA